MSIADFKKKLQDKYGDQEIKLPSANNNEDNLKRKSFAKRVEILKLEKGYNPNLNPKVVDLFSGKNVKPTQEQLKAKLEEIRTFPDRPRIEQKEWKPQQGKVYDFTYLDMSEKERKDSVTEYLLNMEEAKHLDFYIVAKLMNTYGLEQMERQVYAYRFRETSQGKTGHLKNSITEDWDLPPHFEEALKTFQANRQYLEFMGLKGLLDIWGIKSMDCNDLNDDEIREFVRAEMEFQKSEIDKVEENAVVAPEQFKDNPALYRRLQEACKKFPGGKSKEEKRLEYEERILKSKEYLELEG